MVDKCLLPTLFFFGRIFSPLYSLAMRLRAMLYTGGVLASTRLPLPVISVGNLTMGGTGKTPMVIYLARLLAKAGLRPAILSRGYGGRSQNSVNLVSDGREVLLSPEEAGDEPVLLAQSLPGVPVVTARKRSLGGEFFVRQGGADILILDDGFQHLALRRDLDLVLFSASSPIESDWVFPGGTLREPGSALGRADCFILTGMELPAGTETLSLQPWLHHRYPRTPMFAGQCEPVSLSCPGQGRVGVALDTLASVPLFAFCGIANPDSFRQSLERDFEIKGWQQFADHHPFRREEIEGLARRAEASGCLGLITTEKDFVKIKAFRVEVPIWVLSVELRMEKGFDRFVLERLGQCGK